MATSQFELALSTDLYELTMASSYDALGRHGRAVFSLYVRKLPEHRHFLVVAGVNELLERLVALRFDDETRAYLRTLPMLRPDFVDSLASFRFHGDVWAVREGTVIFADEPILEVEAPIDQAQLVETLVLNAIHYPTLVATKAARCRLAAPGKTLVDFGLRRTPSLEAGLAAARAAYLAGFAATSNVLAGARYGIPVSGTVAHSFIESFPSELEAFRAFARTYPGDPILLIDTYDTLRGAEHAVIVARELAAEGRRVRAVRLDSGDLAELSRAVRALLDRSGFPDIQIFASGGLDEYELHALEATGAPIDGYGIGSRLGTSTDAPLADMAYKLVEYDGEPVLKLSTGKRTLVGAKQVWRRIGRDGHYSEDLIALRDEPPPGPDWIPLLRPVMRGGEILERPALPELRAHHQSEIDRLPPWLRVLAPTATYPVRLSDRLRARQLQAEETIRRREGL
ncbi:MAG: nicotinate phosphoribosyltransferase [Thermomicrobium sp.]|nr:nicotinate phosphoribosyltransferase [Thermomicrobium sp.]MDW7982398.1 nicotinate phosphoribosyltransferase [Thermomicrobium sp.]